MGKKWDDKRNGEKLLHLFTLLMYRERQWPLKELAKELNCSKPTVIRLVDQLNSSLYASVWQEKVGRESYYSLKSSRARPIPPLNVEGLRQLSICRDFILHLLPDDARKALEVTMAQAQGLADNDPEGVVPSLPADSLVKGFIDYGPHQEAYTALTRGIRLQRVVSVSYRPSLQPEANPIDFAPKLLSLYHETLRFTGWIVDEKNRARFETPTSLLLHRVQEATLTSRRASRLPDPRTFEDGHFGLIRGEPFEVVVRFSPEASQYVHEREWSKGQKMKLLGDGSLELSMTSQSEVEVFQWVLSFGQRAEVLSPDWLREDVLKEAALMLEKYGPEKKGA
jgi:predicted DNA-binding transcriptional regulator YafY